MRFTALVAMALCAWVQPCIAWSFGPMSPELWDKANKNWNATIAAYYQSQKDEPSDAAGSCSQDLRKTTPACLQYEEDWCWATGIAELSSHYNPTKYPSKDDDCHGLECQVISLKYGGDETSCCNNTNFCGDGKSCCKGPFGPGNSCEDKCRGFAKKIDGRVCMEETCKSIGGTTDDILKGLAHFTGKPHVNRSTGPLSPSELDAVLSKGHPVIISVYWSLTSGHALTLGGCAAAGGPYYLHDPLDKAGVYQTLTYDKIAEYTPPWGPSYRGKWFETFYPQGDLLSAEEEESILV